MEIAESLDIINGSSMTVASKYDLLWELIEAGYDIILYHGQFLLVDDCTYARDIRS